MKHAFQAVAATACLFGLSLLITPPPAKAEPVDLYNVPPLFLAATAPHKIEYQPQDEIISSTAIKREGRIYRLGRFRPRSDAPINEGKDWLKTTIAQLNTRYREQGFDVVGCKPHKQDTFVCEEIQIRAIGQDIGLLGVVSGVSEEY